MKKKTKHKKKHNHIVVKKHHIRRRKLSGDTEVMLDVVVCTVYLFALIKLENPVLLFFLAPFLLDIV